MPRCEAKAVLDEVSSAALGGPECVLILECEKHTLAELLQPPAGISRGLLKCQRRLRQGRTRLHVRPNARKPGL